MMFRIDWNISEYVNILDQTEYHSKICRQLVLASFYGAEIRLMLTILI